MRKSTVYSLLLVLVLITRGSATLTTPRALKCTKLTDSIVTKSEHVWRMEQPPVSPLTEIRITAKFDDTGGYFRLKADSDGGGGGGGGGIKDVLVFHFTKEWVHEAPFVLIVYGEMRDNEWNSYKQIIKLNDQQTVDFAIKIAIEENSYHIHYTDQSQRRVLHFNYNGNWEAFQRFPLSDVTKIRLDPTWRDLEMEFCTKLRSRKFIVLCILGLISLIFIIIHYTIYMTRLYMTIDYTWLIHDYMTQNGGIVLRQLVFL